MTLHVYELHVEMPITIRKHINIRRARVQTAIQSEPDGVDIKGLECVRRDTPGVVVGMMQAVVHGLCRPGPLPAARFVGSALS